MYFPYLRGKKNEVLALRELTPLLVRSNNITAIIEPVKRGKDGRGLNQIAKVAAAIGSLIIVENPERGDFAGSHQPIRHLFAGPLSGTPGVMPGFIASSQTTTAQCQAFLARHQNRPVAFLHFGSVPEPEALERLQNEAGNTAYNVFLSGRSSRSYMRGFHCGGAVLLEDRFQRQAKNQDYPPREFFSDLHKRYAAEEFQGFGDFSIVGNHYMEGGGPAYCVAIHLVNREGSNEVWMRHFLSDRTQGTADIPGKFLEALRKTARFIESGENWLVTEGCREFIALNQRQHFPGLGFVKKISIKHHLELMDAVLSA
jgi:hypothetical protein